GSSARPGRASRTGRRARGGWLRWCGRCAGWTAKRLWRIVKGLGRVVRRLPRAALRLGPSRLTRRRAYRAFGRLPFGVQVVLSVAVIAAAWAPANWLFQVVRKPSELFFPVSG